MRIGFIGAGRMGRPMVDRLRAAGHDVLVHARSGERRDELAADGVAVTGDVAAVADGAEVVVVCVFTDEQVRQVCLDGELVSVMPDGAALVVHTTGSPHTVQDIAALAAGKGIDVVDAPVSGGPHDIAAGTVTLYAGGTGEAFGRVEPVLACYGSPVLHVGALGTGQRVKMINNALFAAHIGLLTDAVRLAGELGVAEDVLLESLTHGSGVSRAALGASARGSVEGFRASAGQFVAKDVAVARQVATELGGDLGTIDAAIDAAQL